MSTRTLGVIMTGVTGRMGHRRHLVRSVLAINEQGEPYAAPFPHDFASGARGVYVADAGRRSSDEGRRIELEPPDDHP